MKKTRRRESGVRVPLIKGRGNILNVNQISNINQIYNFYGPKLGTHKSCDT